MSIRISWDKYETALLIEAALIVIDDNSSRTRIVKKLSSQLRQLAINRGYIIDDVFRNENGIRMQMITIIDILTSTKSGLRNASKLFYEMADLYKFRRDEFDGVLEEAKRMISQPKDVQQDFFLWLSKKVSSKQLSELYITYKAIEEYGKSKKILPDDLFKITDKAIISKLLASSYGIRKSAIVYYCKYLDEKYPISYEKKESTLISSTELEKNIQAIDPSHKIVNNKDERKCTFDFNQVNYLKGTNPIYAIVYVVKISEPYSWIDLYVKLVKKIWKWHKLDLLSYRGKSFTNKTKISMGSNHDFKYMLSPIKITSDVYLETELTLDEIEENIRALKNICSISKSNIKIVYETNETNIDVTQDNVSEIISNDSSNDSAEAEIASSPTYIDKTENNSKYEEILNVHFRKGFRLSSPIDLKKFKGYYEKTYSESIDLSDDSIILMIKQQGIVYDDKVFLPSSLLNDETKNEIIKYIETEFSKGTESIYYSALFEKFSDAFLDSQIYNDEILKEYLSFINTDLFFIHRSYLTSRSGEADSVAESVKKCLIENGHPMQMDDIYRKLSHLPRSKVKFALASNKEFISNGHNVYFHIKIADIDDKDLRLISNIIENAITEKDFISGGELYSAIEKKDSIIIEKNPELSVIGLRDAIKYHLENEFSFNGNIISKRGEQLSMYEVFADFSRNHFSFTLDELTVLKQELGTNIYFEAVYNNSLRISGNDFVSKDRAAFDVEATDKAIEAFCFGDYISLSDITSFSSFPDAGFAWNTYLLESYAAAYSKKFCLIHNVDKVLEKLNAYSGDALIALMDKIARVSDERQMKMLSMDTKKLCDWIKETIIANDLKAIVFIWDEFTEYFYNNSRNLTGFQEIVDMSATDPFYLVIVTHKSSGLFDDSDKDKSKILDRFVKPTCIIELPENMAFQLMGAAMEKNEDEAVRSDWEITVGDLYERTHDSRQLVKSRAKITDDELKNILPIHPYTALLLKHISSAFDSNQRSMFDFIKNDRGDDIKGFQWFIDNFGPEDDNPLLTIDMLWEFFYDKGKEYLSHDIRSILDCYSRSISKKLDTEEQRVLKTVLLLQAISQKVGDTVELFIPNEKNVNNAFEGSDIEHAASRIAEKLCREEVLYKKPLGGGAMQYSAMVNAGDMAAIEKLKEEVKKKTTSSLITDGALSETMTLNGALKLRYRLEFASVSDFEPKIKMLRNKVSDYTNNIFAVVTFAKDDSENAVIGKKIKDALRGAGFLYIKKGTPIVPLMNGGAQENKSRAGTENVAAILAMAIALKNNCEHIEANRKHIQKLSDEFLTALKTEYKLNGINRYEGIHSLSFKNASGETLLHRLDLKGISISTGSACDSVNTQISHVLNAIKLDEEYAIGTIRVSFGKDNTIEEAVAVAKAIDSILMK